MTELAQKAVDWTQRHQSRRGFMALSGKVALALGLAMAGVTAIKPHVARATACCAPPPCMFCPNSSPCTTLQPQCPVGCTWVSTAQCCDNPTGGTHTIHFCFSCNCAGSGCVCECDSGIAC